MGQFSMEIMPLPGSLLGGNQQQSKLSDLSEWPKSPLTWPLGTTHLMAAPRLRSYDPPFVSCISLPVPFVKKGCIGFRFCMAKAEICGKRPTWRDVESGCDGDWVEYRDPTNPDLFSPSSQPQGVDRHDGRIDERFRHGLPA